MVSFPAKRAAAPFCLADSRSFSLIRLLSYNNNLCCICISIGEINALLTLRSNSHSGCAKICFSAVDGCKDSFKCHILDFQLITKLIADGRGISASIPTISVPSLYSHGSNSALVAMVSVPLERSTSAGDSYGCWTTSSPM